jgi:hypothetical protein
MNILEKKYLNFRILLITYAASTYHVAYYSLQWHSHCELMLNLWQYSQCKRQFCMARLKTHFQTLLLIFLGAFRKIPGPGLRLVQPRSPTDRHSVLFPPFYLKTEAESSFRNVIALLFYNLDDGQIQNNNFTNSLSSLIREYKNFNHILIK